MSGGVAFAAWLMAGCAGCAAGQAPPPATPEPVTTLAVIVPSEPEAYAPPTDFDLHFGDHAGPAHARPRRDPPKMEVTRPNLTKRPQLGQVKPARGD